MARQGRDEQHARLLGVAVLGEAQQRAERRAEDGLLAHRDLPPADRDRVDAERRASIVRPQRATISEVASALRVIQRSVTPGERSVSSRAVVPDIARTGAIRSDWAWYAV